MPLIQTLATLSDRRAQAAAVELTLHAPDMARLLLPGQPVLIKAGPALSPYLRRGHYPVALGAEDFAIRIAPSSDWGDAYLRVAAPGSALDCLGPVGSGYTIDGGVRNLLCVGEGEGTWRLLPLIDWADAAGLSVTLVASASSARVALPAARLPAGVEYHLVLADGIAQDGRPDRARPLLSTLSDLLPWADALAGSASLDLYGGIAQTIRETRFALTRGFAQAIYPMRFLCGTGACQGCVADVAGGRRRVCLRGPVFDLVDIVGRQAA